MQFKRQRRKTTLPEINLVPTIDVVMCVLTFFLILSMTLDDRQTHRLELPQAGTESQENSTENLTLAEEILNLSLNREGELFWRDRLLSEADLTEIVPEFLAEYPDGKIILAADRQLPYQQITQILQTLGELGGDRVSLAIQ